MTTETRIQHITTIKDWQAAKAKNLYDFDALKKEGFIHCSYPNQTIATANRFFKTMSDLIVLEVEIEKCQAEIKIEKAFDIDEMFPHIYGPINLDAVVKTYSLEKNSDGRFEKLREI